MGFKLACLYNIYLGEMIGDKERKKESGGTSGLQTLKIVDGKYMIKNKKLGEGSFAETFLAIDNANGQELACKMISKKHLIEKINASKHKTLTKEYFITALKN